MTLTTEQLREIAEKIDLPPNNMTTRVMAEMARELLANREAGGERQRVIDGLARAGEAWADIEEYMEKWDSYPVRYQWREIGEGGWKDCDKARYDYCQRMPELDVRIITAPPAPAVPDGVMPGGLVYSSALPKFESNDSDKIVGYCCFISGETRSVESQEQAYADAKAVINACRAAMLAQPLPADLEKYTQGIKDGLEWAARTVEANHPDTCDWLYDDRDDLAKAIRKGPDMLAAAPEAK